MPSTSTALPLSGLVAPEPWTTWTGVEVLIPFFAGKQNAYA